LETDSQPERIRGAYSPERVSFVILARVGLGGCLGLGLFLWLGDFFIAIAGGVVPQASLDSDRHCGVVYIRNVMIVK
jgi:hypothetical protein